MEGPSENVTKVISVRGRDRLALLADPYFRYVGRSVPRAKWEQSDFQNPYTLSAYPKTAVEQFERSILAGLGLGTYPEAARCLSWRFKHQTFWNPIARRLRELKGKTLGCWCCDWDGTGEPAKPCHAVVLARLADGIGRDA